MKTQNPFLPVFAAQMRIISCVVALAVLVALCGMLLLLPCGFVACWLLVALMYGSDVVLHLSYSCAVVVCY